MSTQRIRMIKAKTERITPPFLIQSGIGSSANAQGDLKTVYFAGATIQAAVFEELLRAIGYWGQASFVSMVVGV